MVARYDRDLFQDPDGSFVHLSDFNVLLNALSLAHDHLALYYEDPYGDPNETLSEIRAKISWARTREE